MLEPDPAPWAWLEAVHDGGLLERIRGGTLTLRESRGLGLPWSPELVERGAAGGRRQRRGGALRGRARARHEPRRRHPPRRPRLRARLLPVQRRRGGAARAALRGPRASARWSSTATSTRATAPRDLLGRRRRARSRSRCTARATTRSSGSRPTSTSTSRPAPATTHYLAALDEALDVALPRARADVAFYLAGADPWEGDRLGRLALTKAGLRARDELVLDRLRAAGARVCVVLAGGYAEDVRDTVDINAATAAAVGAAAYPEGDSRGRSGNGSTQVLHT